MAISQPTNNLDYLWPTPVEMGHIEAIFCDLEPDAVLKLFANEAEERLRTYLEKCNCNKTPTGYKKWVSEQPYGQSLPPHYHHNVLATMVLWLSATKDSGALVLIDPRGVTHRFGDFQNNYSSPLVQYSLNGIKIVPEPLKFIIFPGYVTHYCETNLSHEPRVSLVFNAVSD
ncbi:MAG: hypothetical protein ING36_15330 [Burkholderiales bacterium]|nr:hypothetical protein [Burkholderiales bacterium]